MNRMMSIVLTGVSSDADGKTETINSILAGAAPIENKSVAYPFGFASRSPDGMAQLLLQVGNSPSARVITGHFDPTRPPLNGGESVLYNQFGRVVYVAKDAIRLGSMDADQAFVMGNVFNGLLESLYQSIITHTHAAPGAPPTNVAEFQEQKADYVDNDALLSTIVKGI